MAELKGNAGSQILIEWRCRQPTASIELHLSAQMFQKKLFDSVKPISFTEETLSQPRDIEITAKSHVTIECSLIGYPHPDIVWLKLIRI